MRMRNLQNWTLVASLLMMASAAAIAIPYVTERQQQARAPVTVPEPTSVAATRSEPLTPLALATVCSASIITSRPLRGILQIRTV